MLGTHDSMTYLPPRWWIFRPFAWLWRTQTKSLAEQVAKGVKYIDIRVKRSGDKWVFCHGLVELHGDTWSLPELSLLCRRYVVRARMILERGDERDEQWFGQCALAIMGCPEIAFIGIKKGWKVLKNQDPPIKDCTYVPFLSNRSLWWNLRHMKLSTIARWAKKHNPPITTEILENETIYFVDRL